MTNFKGSIDQFLDHCSKLNVDVIEAELERDSCIKEIANSMDIDIDEATKMLEQFQLEIVQAELNKLMEEGLIEITKYENGEPLYGLTESGKKVLDDNKIEPQKPKSKKKKDI
jgi:hypothetical protein